MYTHTPLTLVTTVFDMYIDAHCFPTFPWQNFPIPNVKSSCAAFAGAGTVITILVVLAWPQESQGILNWLLQPIFGHRRLELLSCLCFGILGIFDILSYPFVSCGLGSVDPCWTWLCGLQVLLPAAARGGTGDWGTIEVFSASTVSMSLVDRQGSSYYQATTGKPPSLVARDFAVL